MKTSDKLYTINANISLHFIAKNKPMSHRSILLLNQNLGELIKEIRELEDHLDQTTPFSKDLINIQGGA